MKKLLSFVAALILCGLTSAILLFFVNTHRNIDSVEFGTWINEAKFSSYQMMNENMGKNDLLVLGSSEFKHGRKTPYHPENMFKGQKNHLMLVGKEYYQSLNHAITLAAMAPELKNKKVVLILSPQWFDGEGIDSQAFSERFSENNYIGMLNNFHITAEDKEYIRERCKNLLQADKGKEQRILTYDRIYHEKKQKFFEKSLSNIYTNYIQEKSVCSVLFKALITGMLEDKDVSQSTSDDIDWDYYEVKAQKEGIEKTKGNLLNVSDSFYKKKIKPKLKDLKGFKKEVSFDASPEYADLVCFLNICKSNDIEVLLINTPINGKWYDYAGCNKEKREVYYDKIRTIAKDYKVSLVDLSDNEYAEGYFSDTVHFGWKGWVDVNEAIYRFQTNS